MLSVDDHYFRAVRLRQPSREGIADHGRGELLVLEVEQPSGSAYRGSIERLVLPYFRVGSVLRKCSAQPDRHVREIWFDPLGHAALVPDISSAGKRSPVHRSHGSRARRASGFAPSPDTSIVLARPFRHGWIEPELDASVVEPRLRALRHQAKAFSDRQSGVPDKHSGLEAGSLFRNTLQQLADLAPLPLRAAGLSAVRGSNYHPSSQTRAAGAANRGSRSPEIGVIVDEHRCPVGGLHGPSARVYTF